MSKSEVDRFFKDVMENEDLKKKYEELAEEVQKKGLHMEDSYMAVGRFAYSNGYDLKWGELYDANFEMQTKNWGKKTKGAYDCACIIGGGGKGETYTGKKPNECSSCACVLGGVGMYYNAGARCACPLAGGGVS